MSQEYKYVFKWKHVLWGVGYTAIVFFASVFTIDKAFEKSQEINEHHILQTELHLGPEKADEMREYKYGEDKVSGLDPEAVPEEESAE
jgi:hypothetical protein